MKWESRTDLSTYKQLKTDNLLKPRLFSLWSGKVPPIPTTHTPKLIKRLTTPYKQPSKQKKTKVRNLVCITSHKIAFAHTPAKVNERPQMRESPMRTDEIEGEGVRKSRFPFGGMPP